ncbi:MAG: isoprenylcysteine carboxylmethyltransferase family protein [FCB group bacterium]|jgi:protein-S-isoprenylcysteine O-methyltransferase Ste14|nr:isoprenylcysteine carboxylmethyltransferase family protein [FCB group bacterium]
MARKGWRPVPALYFFAAVLAMAALHKWLPVARVIQGPYHLLGIVLMVSGVGLSLLGALLFVRRGTPFRPFAKSARLVTVGPYRLSRNPMYTGLVVALGGMALFLGTLTPWVIVPVFVWLIQRFVIRVEEALLSETFGPEYEAYRARVGRWL